MSGAIGGVMRGAAQETIGATSPMKMMERISAAELQDTQAVIKNRSARVLEQDASPHLWSKFDAVG